jgi:hypothetical protein
MLADPKSAALADSFLVQWLTINHLKDHLVDPMLGTFDDAMKSDMFTETKMLLSHIIGNDLNIKDLLTADYTFVNERLATLYGILGVTGNEFRKVSIASLPRRGVLTHASFLTANSYPTESHIIKRGIGVLRKITCNPPPGLPMNNGFPIPALAGNTPREKLEAHRANPVCAGCHKYMDPIGFGLERFDLMGRYRERYSNGMVVDSTGSLSEGESFTDAIGLISFLAADDKVNTCISQKLLTYALGRAVGESDQCSIDELADKLRDAATFSDFVLAAINTVQFRQQQGEAF